MLHKIIPLFLVVFLLNCSPTEDESSSRLLEKDLPGEWHITSVLNSGWELIEIENQSIPFGQYISDFGALEIPGFNSENLNNNGKNKISPLNCLFKYNGEEYGFTIDYFIHDNFIDSDTNILMSQDEYKDDKIGNILNSLFIINRSYNIKFENQNKLILLSPNDDSVLMELARI